MIGGEVLADEIVLGPLAGGEQATLADGRVFHLRVERVGRPA